MLLLSPEEVPQLFADVTPVSQPPSPGGVCEIQYADGFVIAYDYFRAIVTSREVSERVLQLTELCATLNPANYTVWQHRRFVWRQLIAVDTENTKRTNEGTAAVAAAAAAAPISDVEDDDDSSAPRTLRARVEYELQLASRLGGANPKTYQIWYHRRAVVEHLHELASTDDIGNHDGALRLMLQERIHTELEYLRTVVRADGKNYHAWSYRQFLLMLMMQAVPTVPPSGQDTYKDDDDDGDCNDVDNVWSNELQYASELIDDDGRNNSAWNHRWFVLMNDATNWRKMMEEAVATEAATETAVLDENVVAREVRYALEVASIDPYNESPWRFFVALVRHHVRGLRLLVEDDEGNNETASPISNVLDMYEQQAWEVMPGASASVRGAALANDEKEEEGDDDDSAAPALSRDVVSPHLVAAVVDLLELSWSALASGSGSGETNSASAPSSGAAPARARWAVHLCTCLEEIDPIRQKYWRYRAAAWQREASPHDDDDDVNVVEEPGR
jgi:protein farnesyltransferase/geranylgeranyltransferase type-1 subunit alpha